MEQTNQYIKQFPELMKGKKILYVHGFGSSGQSGTVTRIREVLPNATVVAPDLPIEPEEAMALLRQVCDSEKPNLIIGTSMGGMYAEMLRGFDRIIVNPALEMGETMKAHGMMGAQHFSNPRLDGVQDFIVTKTLVKAYKEMTEHCFEGLDDADQRHVWGLFGDADTTVDTYDLFHTHYQTAIRFHGEHRMNDQSFMHAVVPVIRWIDDRQEGRERPIVYIDVNTLIDPEDGPYPPGDVSNLLRSTRPCRASALCRHQPVALRIHQRACLRSYGVHQSKNAALRRLSHRCRADGRDGCTDTVRFRHLQDLGRYRRLLLTPRRTMRAVAPHQVVSYHP